MYAELGENACGTKSFDNGSATVSRGGSPQSKKKNCSTKINKNSDLRKSLMEDGENNDLETGRSKSFPGQTPQNISEDDPYYVFREDLLMKLELVTDGLQRYERLIQNTDTSVNSAEIKDGKKQLKRHIKHAESTLRDVQTTVRVVVKKREIFMDIDDAELYDRKDFVQSCTNRIKEAKESMNSNAIKTKILKDERAKTKRRLCLVETKSEDNEEASFITNNHAGAQLMMEQQDETLDELDDAVVRVGHLAENIHEELGQQNKMLSELENDLENAEAELGLVVGKLAKILKTKSKLQLGTIFVLSVIVIILLFLVMYT